MTVLEKFPEHVFRVALLRRLWGGAGDVKSLANPMRILHDVTGLCWDVCILYYYEYIYNGEPYPYIYIYIIASYDILFVS